MRTIRKSLVFMHFLLPLSNRNPDGDVGPWCYIYKYMRLTWELCDIPKCCELSHDPFLRLQWGAMKCLRSKVTWHRSDDTHLLV